MTRFLPDFTEIIQREVLKTSLHRYRKIRPVEQYRRAGASSYVLQSNSPSDNKPREKNKKKKNKDKKKRKQIVNNSTIVSSS